MQKIIDNKDLIIDSTLEWQKEHHTYRSVRGDNFNKCRRDLSYVFDAYINDLKNSTIEHIVDIGSKYWKKDKRQIIDYSTELESHNYMVNYIIENHVDDGDIAEHLLLLKNILLKIIVSGPISGIEKVYKNRRQIRCAWDTDRIPSKELIHDLLQRTLDIAPSKQNLFPFKIHAFGPENREEREKVSKICALFPTGSVNNWEEADEIAVAKKETNKDAPWVLVFELRQCEPNVFVNEHSELHNDWKRFTQIDERFRETTNRTLAAIEVGMYCKLLAGLCLENDLAISYIKSFPEWSWAGKRGEYNKNINKVGLSWDSLPQITEAPLLVVQIGYKADMMDILATNAFDPNMPFLEDKPSLDKVVSFY